MLKESRTNEQFEYQRLSQEEQQKRGILGRLVGVCADLINPTRNGRKYSEQLWENVFKDPIMKEKIANRCCFGELGHPSDRTETDMSKIAICLAEQPVKGPDGKLRAIFDIIDTPNGRILKSLCDYGCNIGISSRGEGDLITDYDGQEAVDPNTYSCECFDAVLIPAVKEARLTYVSESLDKKRYNKTLKQSLQEALDKASEEDKKVMQETLDNLNINLNEETIDEMATPIGRYVIVDATTHNSLFYAYDIVSGFKKLLSRPADKLNLEYQRFIDSIKDADGSYTLFKRITDLSELEGRPGWFPVYIDGYLDTDWFKTGNTTNISAALASNNVVLQYLQPKKTKGKAPVFMEALEKVDLKTGKVEEDCASDGAACDKDIKDESLNINEAKHVAVDNNEAIVEELQKLIKANAELEQTVISLQEKLSVCYAKENQLTEEVNKYKLTVGKLAKDAKNANALQSVASSLETQLKEAKDKEIDLRKQLSESKEKVKFVANKNAALKESISRDTSNTNKLNESINSLQEQLENEKKNSEKIKHGLAEAYNKKLKEVKANSENEKAELNNNISKLQESIKSQQTEFSQKLEKANTLVEKYKKATATAIEKYMESQAVRLGSSVSEIKTRLPESYSFKDIDRVCGELQTYNLNMSKLPFNATNKKSINESVKIAGTSSKNEYILPANSLDDDIDADLLYLAGTK